jgi:solute carrier family 31 (copper transporter), member 1
VLFSWCAFSKPQFKRNAIRSLFTGIIVFLDYMLMLIVMTFNIGIILAVVFGFMVGTLFLGHTGEKAGSIHTGGASGNVDPTDELDVRFMEAPSCCGTTGFI